MGGCSTAARGAGRGHAAPVPVGMGRRRRLRRLRPAGPHRHPRGPPAVDPQPLLQPHRRPHPARAPAGHGGPEQLRGRGRELPGPGRHREGRQVPALVHPGRADGVLGRRARSTRRSTSPTSTPRSVVVSEDRRSVTISLPPPTLSAPHLDLDQSQVVSRDRGLLDRLGSVFSDTPTGERELQLAAQEKMRAAAAASDLSARAEAEHPQDARVAARQPGLHQRHRHLRPQPRLRPAPMTARRRSSTRSWSLAVRRRRGRTGAEVHGGRRRPGGGRRRRRPRRGTRSRPGGGPRSSTPPPACWPSGSEDFARTIALESAKPIKTARIEATRAVSTFTFAAVEARRLTGDMVPIDAAEVGEGRLAFTLRVPDRRGRRHLAVQLPPQPGGPQAGAGHRRRLPGGAQAGQPDAAHRRRPGRPAGRRVRPARRLPPRRHRRRRPRWATPSSRHPDVAYLTFTGSGEVGWAHQGAGRAQEGGPRAGQQLAGDHRGRRRLGGGGPHRRRHRLQPTPASRACRCSGSTCTATVADDFTATLAAPVDDLVVGDPLDESTDVSALISTDDRDRVVAWIDEAVAAGRPGRHRRRGRRRRPAPPDGAGRRHAPTCGCAGTRCSARWWPSRPTPRLDEALRLADDTRYGLQAGIFTSSLATALRAARELHFGTVLVNEVPTWRADQMPYGGVRASGNTKEGPACGRAGDDRGAPGRHPGVTVSAGTAAPRRRRRPAGSCGRPPPRGSCPPGDGGRTCGSTAVLVSTMRSGGVAAMSAARNSHAPGTPSDGCDRAGVPAPEFPVRKPVWMKRVAGSRSAAQ